MTESLNKIIGRNLKEIRTRKGYTQESLAVALDDPVTPQQVGNWENGNSSVPTDRLVNLAAILQISIEDILDDQLIRALSMKAQNDEAALLRSYRKLKDKSARRAARNLIDDLVKALTRNTTGDEHYGKE